VFDKAGMLAGRQRLPGLRRAIFGSLWRARQRSNVTTYGSARWATADRGRAAGLLGERGVLLGRWAALSAPRRPRACHGLRADALGQGRRPGRADLLLLDRLTVVHDIKGENWTLTAGWRARFSHCLLFNPTDRARRATIRCSRCGGADEVRDVQNIADMLVDPEGALERATTGRRPATRCWSARSSTSSTPRRRRRSPGRDLPVRSAAPLRRDAAPRMMATNHLARRGAAVHPVVASAAREVLNKSENERSGVLSTAMSFLGLYRDPTVAEVTSRCDWRIADLVDGERPSRSTWSCRRRTSAGPSRWSGSCSTRSAAG
jgi:type IV secretion system protein VirD4